MCGFVHGMRELVVWVVTMANELLSMLFIDLAMYFGLHSEYSHYHSFVDLNVNS